MQVTKKKIIVLKNSAWSEPDTIYLATIKDHTIYRDTFVMSYDKFKYASFRILRLVKL